MFVNKIITMKPQSEIIIASALALIDDKIWQGVAVQNIKRLALHSARLEGLEVLHSHVSNQQSNKEKRGNFNTENDPTPIPLDTFAIGSTQVEVDKTSRADKAERKSSIGNISVKAHTKKFTESSFFSKKATEPRRTEYEEKKIVLLPEVQDEHIVEDPEEDNLRINMFKAHKYDAEMKQLVERRKKQREQSDVINKKAFKDVKKFTFDYGGKFCTIGNLDLGAEKPIKLLRKDGDPNITKKQSKNPEYSVIENEQLKNKGAKKGLKSDKNAPNFDENRPESLLDLMKGDTDISEGVKFIAQKGSQRLVKEKKRQALSGVKKYRLSQYQGMSKDSKFKQFRSKALNSVSSATIDVNKTTPLPIQQISESREIAAAPTERQDGNRLVSHSEQVLRIDKGKDPYMMLPPLKHNLFTRRKGAYSNRTIDISQAGSRVTNKSKITVDHEQLFQVNFKVHALD